MCGGTGVPPHLITSMKRLLCPLFALLLMITYSSAGEGSSAKGDTSVAQRSPADMHVVILGDSNSSIGGDSCNLAPGWTKWFNEAFAPASCRSYARSGATWTNTSRTVRNEEENTGLLSDNNVIYNQVCRLISAHQSGIQPTPNLIIVAAGTNDAWFLKRRPKALQPAIVTDTAALSQLKPSSILTLADAVTYNCLLLKRHFPEARIILLTPMQCTATTTERIRTVGDIISRCGELLDLPVVRQDSICCISREQEAVHHRYTVDGIHTNAAGAEINGLRLAHVIDSIMQH